ncbi:MAG: DUF393 domain-containing protein [Cyclobacteriaceae bacterium]|nr:DUF393 domain-containing protein [Cyclobacteriaceae bacterium]
MANRAAQFPSSNARNLVAEPALILYDGVCHLCQGFVRFIIKRDPHRKFRFGFLQSPAGQDRLRAFPDLTPGIDTVVLIEGNRAYTRSTAALRIARQLSGGWPLFYAFVIVPPFIRDKVYDVVARYRYRWFGRSDACERPAEEVGDRFMD